MERNNIQTHAPYVYLNKKRGSHEYFLFLTLKIKPGFQLQNSIQTTFQNGLTLIHLTVIKAENAGGTEITECFQLMPLNQADLDFNPDTSKIEVLVSVFENDNIPEEEFSTTLLYRDGDEFELAPFSIQDKVAYNCPYVYLERQAATENPSQSNGLSTCIPYLLIPLRGYSPVLDMITRTSPGNGVCEAYIVLRNTPDNATTHSFSEDFKINSDFYLDDQYLEGNFTATIILEHNIPLEESMGIKTIQEFSTAVQELEIEKHNDREDLPSRTEEEEGDSNPDNEFDPEEGNELPLPPPTDKDEPRRDESDAPEDGSRRTSSIRAKTRNMSSRPR